MIKFVYFDIGGTVIKDFSKRPDLWSDFKKDLKITDEYWEKYCSPVLDIGGVPENLPVSFDKLIDRFVSHFEKNELIWEPVNISKEKFRVGLLTNMYLGMFEKIQKSNLLPPINWEIIIDTSIVKLKKPEEKIYLLAQEKTHVNPSEILFVDNVEKNLEVPKQLGWSVFYYDSSDYELSSKNLLEYIQHEFTE